MSPDIESGNSDRVRAVRKAFESTDWGEQQVEMGNASHKAGMLEQFFRRVGQIFSASDTVRTDSDITTEEPQEYHTAVSSTEAMVRAMTKTGKKTK